jgi:hypothetical protein
MVDTCARVDLLVFDNLTFEDAFQFGVSGDTTWNFTDQNFRMDVKGTPDDAAPLLTLLSTAGQIVVDDAVARVLHFNVPESVIQAALTPGEYVYDLVMFDGSTPPVRVGLMRGSLCVAHGISGG